MPSRSPLHGCFPKRIALIKPSALGDIMHSLPVVSALRQRFPEAHITWVVNKLYEPLLHQHPDLNGTLAFDRQLMRRGWVAAGAEFARFLGLLRERRFDLTIDLQGLLRTGLMSLATGARYRIGLASAREGARWFYTHAIDDGNGDVHAVDRYWRVVEALGVGTGNKRFLLPVDESARHWAGQHLATHPRPWLAVGVGSRWLTKRWPPQHFAALVRLALERFGGTAIFIGTPDEIELSRLAAEQLPGSINLTGRTSLPELAAILSKSDLLLANDTGPLHLAVALGRPVIAPYTCTLIQCTGPYGQSAQAVQTSVWCRGSCLRQCDRLECMAELTPARLWPILEGILHAWQRQRHAA